MSNNQIVRASISDKNVVIDIVEKAFAEDPNYKWVIEKSISKQKTRDLAVHMVDEAFEKCEIYLTKGKEGCIWWYNENKKGLTLNTFKRDLKFIFTHGYNTCKRGLEFNTYTSKTLKKNKHYNYFHLIGVLPEHQGKGVASVLMDNTIYDKLKDGKPMYIQTSNPRNVEIYKNRGFKVFEEHKLGGECLVWFMKYDKK